MFLNHLFHSENIFKDVDGLETEIIDDLKTSTLSTILIDNSTVDYAFKYIVGNGIVKYDFIPNKTELYINSLYELINAIVLYDNIIVGPSSTKTSYWREDLESVNTLIKISNEFVDHKKLFTLFYLARHKAIGLLNNTPKVITTLSSMVGRKLNRTLVQSILTDMTPKESSHSSHRWKEIAEQGDIEEHYYTDFVIGLIVENDIAMNAVDSSNAGRRWKAGDYWALAKRGDLEFPNDNLDEYYASSLLFRTIFYLLLSDILGCSYKGDMVRSELVKIIINSDLIRTKEFSEVIIEKLSEQERIKDNVMNDILGYEVFKFSVPLVSQYVLKRSNKIEDILKVALEVRNSKAAMVFRNFSFTVDEAISKGDIREVEKAFEELSIIGIQGFGESKKGDELITNTQQVIKVGSPILAAMFPFMKNSFEKTYNKFRYPKLVFLEQLRSTSRIMGGIEHEIRRIRMNSH